jgi:hypothetical protein
MSYHLKIFAAAKANHMLTSTKENGQIEINNVHQGKWMVRK